MELGTTFKSTHFDGIMDMASSSVSAVGLAGFSTGLHGFWSLTPEPVVSFYLTTRGPHAWELPLLCKWSTHDRAFWRPGWKPCPEPGARGWYKRGRRVVPGIRPTGLTQRVGSRNRGPVTPQLPPPQSDYVSGPWLTR